MPKCLCQPKDTKHREYYRSTFQHFLGTLEGGFGDVGTADDPDKLPFSAAS
jgi:hypothetical protein